MTRRLPKTIPVHLTPAHFSGANYTLGRYTVSGENSCALSRFLHEKYPEIEAHVLPDWVELGDEIYLMPAGIPDEIQDHHSGPTGYVVESKVGKSLKFKLTKEVRNGASGD